MVDFSLYTEKLNMKVVKYSKKSKTSKQLALRLALWNFKYLFKKVNTYKSSFSDENIHIAIEALGGLGDLIVAVKYIQALKKYLGDNIVIDVICEDKCIHYADFLFSDYKVHIKGVFINYDLYIQFIRFPMVQYYTASRLNNKVLEYVALINKFHQDYIFILRDAFTGTGLSLIEGRTRENQGDIDNILNMKELDFHIKCRTDETVVLDKFNLANTKYITIQTGAGHCWQEIKGDTRQWPLENYNCLVNLIKEKYPDIKIVQLGNDWQPVIANVNKDLRDKTDIEECFAILKNASLHISQEGGLVHARHFLQGGKSIVLFGPTDERFYGYEENINLSKRNCPHACEWLKENWMKKCIKTGGCAECMQNITPEFVMKHIEL